MNFIDLLLDATDEAETPRSFIFWSALCTISAIVSPNVYLNKGGKYPLHPNLYVLLIARSGLGKSLPIFISKKLVSMVNATRVISGRNTIQDIIKQLTITQTDPETGAPRFTDGRGYIISGEFSVSMQRDLDLFTILTDLYDTHANKDGWINSTKFGGKEVIKAPCITLFSGSSPDHFEDYLPKANITGGFIGRTLLIYEEKRWKLNPLSDEDAEEIDYDLLSTHLRMLRGLSGKFKWIPEARKLYDTWYYDFRSKEHDDKTGTIERLPDHILKVAMCISLAKGLDLIIRKEDIELALKVCLRLKQSIKILTSGSGKSSLASQTKIALEIILKSEDCQISRKDLLQRGFGEFNSTELDLIVETLIQTGFIEQIGTQNIEYKVSERGKQIWLKVKEEI